MSTYRIAFKKTWDGDYIAPSEVVTYEDFAPCPDGLKVSSPGRWGEVHFEPTE